MSQQAATQIARIESESARTHRDVAYFDRTVAQLRAYFDHLQNAARTGGGKPASASSNTRRRVASVKSIANKGRR